MKMNSNETKCNIFLGNGLKAMVGMLLVLIAIMLCSCGESSSGKWYYILDPDEGSRYNITFKSSDTLNYDGVDFRRIV